MPDEPPDPALHGLDAGELLARAMQTARPSKGASDWVPPAPETLAQLLPQYRIESMLGHGGMGAVYKGWQPALERAVAIKLLPEELAADEDFVARFTREARTLAQLQHPGIVAVHDFGQTAAGFLYFVMEYVEGTDLQRLLREPRLKPEQAMALIAQICEALQYAHAKGVVHRDIKPANILIATDGRAKIADFGLARPSKGKDANLTQANVVMGTPDYMAPEQRTGHADHRADIFALGVIFYEMLTGQLPRGVFMPPSRRVQVDVRLDEVVVKALQQEPEQRYQQASEMKTDVDRIRTPAPAPAVAKPKRSRGPGLAAAVTVAVLLLVGAVVYWASRERAPALLAAPGTLGPDPLSAATRETPFTNSLGMEFVPVPGTNVLFCTTTTRVRDYRAFVKDMRVPTLNRGLRFDAATGKFSPGGSWEDPGFAQGEDHPVVNVSINEARSFCAWLSVSEGRKYRLPSDHEWSCAAGIGHLEDQALHPVAKSGRIPDVYPWGSAWPPVGKVGNYADATFAEQTLQSDAKRGVLLQYRDGFAETSPVRSFPPNHLGLYDMGGNADQWVDAEFGPDRSNRSHSNVTRGQSWLEGSKARLNSSYRGAWAGDAPSVGIGFRCVVERDSATMAATRRLSTVTPTPLSTPAKVQDLSPAPKPTPISTRTTSAPEDATKETPFSNGLGMKFVPVPIIGGPTNGQRVLFSIWETRVQDYSAFVNETKREWPIVNFPQGPLHPAIMTSAEDADAFCAWLTERERKAGTIRANECYRVPTDHEWSCAVGIGELEDAALSPEKKNAKLLQYPWGNDWPPTPGAGNYADEASRKEGVRVDTNYLDGYNDTYPRTAPVGSFQPNALGIYDLGGNAKEWCVDRKSDGKRVARGACWMEHSTLNLRSSYREGIEPNARYDRNGIRVVLAPADPNGK